MMTANNRLADIAFYEPKVKSFSDDRLTVPGSSYGMRLRQPQPGLDQVQSVIETLRSDSNTRRAAITVYHPVDAVRKSKDIPCAFGMFFHCRQARLHATVIMRSNNALTLLPLNIFEFSMLAEVVAVEAGLELGGITWFVGSMHLFEADAKGARDRLRDTPSRLDEMASMRQDTGHGPLEELTRLGCLEAEMRHASKAIDHRSIGEWVDRFCSELSPYWAQMGLLLLSNVAKRQSANALHQVTDRLNEQFRELAPSDPVPTATQPSEGETLSFLDAGNNSVLDFVRPEFERRFAQHAQSYEERNGPIGATRLLKARGLAFQELAARSEHEPLSWERFELILQSVEA